MLTGALPFDYEYPGDLLVKHVTEPPIRPRDRHPEVAPPLEDLLLRCLAKDPDERFRDAYHFVDELRLARERLGGAATWGGLAGEPGANPESAPDGKPTPVLDPADEAALLRRTFPEGHARPLDAELTVDEAEAGEPDTAAMHVSELAAAVRPGIPAPPGKELAPAPGQAPHADGLGGHRRWRDRFDALALALDAVRVEGMPPPQDVVGALALGGEALRSLERAVADAGDQQQRLETIDEESRSLRATLGARIDALGAQLSQAQGGLEDAARRRNELRGRHAVMDARLRSGQAEEGPADALLWELASVEQELRRQSATCDAIEAQRDELRDELERETESLGDRAAAVVSELDATMARVDALNGALREPLERVEAFVLGAWEAFDGRRGLQGNP